MPRGFGRTFEDCRRDLQTVAINNQLFTQPQADMRRGEIRLAGDVLLAIADGDEVPEPAMMKALSIAETMAHG